MFMSVQQSAHVITMRLSLWHSPARFNSLLVIYLVPHILRVSKIWCQLVSFKQWWEYFGWSNAKTPSSGLPAAGILAWEWHTRLGAYRIALRCTGGV